MAPDTVAQAKAAGLAGIAVEAGSTVVADAAALGKPVGGDLREGKVTLPIIRLLASADGATRALIADVVDERSVTLERWAEITRLLKQSGAIDYATARANEYAHAARQKLSAFPDGPERAALSALSTNSTPPRCLG